MIDNQATSHLPVHDSVPHDAQMLSLTMKTGSLTSLAAFLHPRKAKHKTTFFALLALISVSAYILFLAHPALNLVQVGLRGTDAGSMLPAAAANMPIRMPRVPARRKQKPIVHKHKKPASLRLDPAQELAAVSSFLASLSQNVIPSTVDPTQPIDPHLVLDFDTRSSRAAEEIQSMVDDVWSRNPVMLYCKRYSPVSREIKSMLAGMDLDPPPTIFEVDVRDDADVLGPLISRLTSSDLPVLLIGGQQVGSISDIRSLNASGKLQTMITAAGAVDGAKRRNGRNHYRGL